MDCFTRQVIAEPTGPQFSGHAGKELWEQVDASFQDMLVRLQEDQSAISFPIILKRALRS